MTSDWQSMETLKLDGRQVLFSAPAGVFIAPASPPPSRNVVRGIHKEIYQETGEWPNAQFNPTHWQELPEQPAA